MRSQRGKGGDVNRLLRALVAPVLLVSVLLIVGSIGRTAAQNPRTFRMMVGEPSSLDPNMVTDFSTYVIVQLFEPMYILRTNGSLQFLGAKSFETSADGLTWSEHGVQGGDALGGGADVEHDRLGAPLHHPGGPRAALGLDGDQGAKLVLGVRMEGHPQAVRGFGTFGQRPADEPLPPLALRREAGRGEGAGDRDGWSRS